jgi:hypothetical protein
LDIEVSLSMNTSKYGIIGAWTEYMYSYPRRTWDYCTAQERWYNSNAVVVYSKVVVTVSILLLPVRLYIGRLPQNVLLSHVVILHLSPVFISLFET